MFEEIADLLSHIKQCEIEGTNKNKTLLLGIISEEISLKIEEDSGIDIRGSKYMSKL